MHASAFLLSLALAAVSLPSLASAQASSAAEARVEIVDRLSGQQRVPLKKLQQLDLTDDNGKVNLTAVSRATAAGQAKYEMNARTLAVQANRPSTATNAKEKRQNRSWRGTLTPYGRDVLWTGVLSTSFPLQSFVVDFDTGSTDLILVSDDCTSSQCVTTGAGTTRNRWSDYTRTGRCTTQTFTNYYVGSSTPTSGFVCRDTVYFGRMRADKQTVNIIESAATNGPIVSLPCDGLAGLAFPALSSASASSLPFTFAAQGTAQNIFAFRLSSSGGTSQLSIGSLDSSLYTGSIYYYDYATDPTYQSSIYTYYQLTNGAVYANGVVVPGAGSQFIIDSGSTLIFAPKYAAQAFWAAVPGSAAYTGNTGNSYQYYTFPCNSPPTAAFSFNGSSRQHAVKTKDINLGYLDYAGGTCIGAYVGADFGLSGRTILGDTFMKGWYTIFDNENMRLGLAATA